MHGYPKEVANILDFFFYIKEPAPRLRTGDGATTGLGSCLGGGPAEDPGGAPRPSANSSELTS